MNKDVGMLCACVAAATSVISFSVLAAPGDDVCFYLYAQAGAIPGTSECPFRAASASGGLGTTYCTASDGPRMIEAYCGGATKNAGPPGCDGVGNPINPANGNKYQREVDFEGEGALPLRVVRHYNYLVGYGSGDLARQWRHDYSRRVRHRGDAAAVIRADGREWTYRRDGDAWHASPDVVDTLRWLRDGDGALTGWVLRTVDNEVETYDAAGRLVEIRAASGQSQTLEYSTTGRLLSVTDSESGRALQFAYSGSNIGSITLPDGGVISYQYASGDLVAVHYPTDASTGPLVRTYHYNEPEFTSGAYLAGTLTGITDERGVRFANYEYDASRSAVGTWHADGASAFSVDYTGTGQAVVTEPLGAQIEMAFTGIHGLSRCESRIRTPGAEGPADSRSATFDAAGNLIAASDYNGNLRCLGYDGQGRNLEVARLEGMAAGSNCPLDVAGHLPGAGTVERKISREWHPDWRLETARAEPRLTTRWIYNGQPDPTQGGAIASCAPADALVDGLPLAVPCTRIQQPTDDEDGGLGFSAAADGNSRIWRYSYDAAGRMLSEDGPRDDVADTTLYTYHAADAAACDATPHAAACNYRRGDLLRVENALGHVWEHSAYDGTGRLLSVVDPDGVRTDFTYHPRGWLGTKVRRGSDAGTGDDDLTTLIGYTPNGLVERLTLPDGSFLLFEHDDAQRLRGIEDALGNRIEYTPDAAGNPLVEVRRDPGGVVRARATNVFDALGRLQTQADGRDYPTDLLHDAHGNLVRITDALERETASDYDPLNRVKRQIQDVGGVDAEVGFGYDRRGNLVQVTDPKGLVTEYGLNAFGELVVLDSPDTGVTTYSYNAAGKPVVRVDARGVEEVATYDALDRLTGLTWSDAALSQSFGYDSPDRVCGVHERFGTGRLSWYSDASGRTSLCYDRFGRLVRKVVPGQGGSVMATTYGYDAADRVVEIVLPSGITLDYTRDAAGHIVAISRRMPDSAAADVLVADVERAPFGPVTSITYGNGRQLTRTFDLDYQPLSIQSSASDGLRVDFERDPVGDFTLLESGASAREIEFDALGRLTEFADPQGSVAYGYGYDETGNRLFAESASLLQGYVYAPDSHRLMQVGQDVREYDAAGNILLRNGRTFEYADHGRMSRANTNLPGSQTMHYVYNAEGQRVAKSSLAGTNLRFAYDPQGRLQGEYGFELPHPQPMQVGSSALREYVWMDDLPVVVLTGAESAVHYIEPDHLGTPRAVVDAQRDVVVWHWQLLGEPFGRALPNVDADGDGVSFILPLRFPGQYYDVETGLHYNYFRDYDPSIGRYVQSDPIGLEGGANTYAYVLANPIAHSDPQGTWLPNAVGAVVGGSFGFASSLISEYSKCGNFRGVDWWNVAGSTVLGAAGGALLSPTTFGAGASVATMRGAVVPFATHVPSQLGMGAMAGTTTGWVGGGIWAGAQSKFNPKYHSHCECSF